MDDDMENEIVYELFTAHLHIIWRYLGVTSAGLIELIMPGPGESMKTKILQPGPFMFLMFLVLVASIALQSGGHHIRTWFIRAPYLLGLNQVADSTLKKIGAVGLEVGGSEDVKWEYSEGLVGAYGMQGRRGNMEDRFDVHQDVDVGGKKMSFFGVYDGHGGQFTAEYVKENLFKNTIDKIRQLRSQINSDASNNTPKCSSNNKGTAVKRTNSKGVCEKAENQKNEDTCASEKSKSGAEKRGSVSEKSEESGGKSEASGAKDGASGAKNDASGANAEDKLKQGSGVETLDSKTDSKNKKSDPKTQKSDPKTTKSDPKTQKSDSSSPKVQKTDQNSPQSQKTDPKKGDVSLKKDDNYANVNLLKRNSIKSSGPNGGVPEVPAPPQGEDAGYIDGYGNLNYTKLLTDQILGIDKQVVKKCKNDMDMSGTTAVIGVLEGELLVIANVGDSRAVMGDTRGSAIPLSFDHKPNQLKERRRIKEAGGFINFTGVWRVCGILATSRAIGDYPLKEPRPLVTAEPDVLTFSLRDHKAQFVILATDGLWDVMSNEEAVAYIAPRLSHKDHGAASLAKHAYAKGSQDNITVAVLNVADLAR